MDKRCAECGCELEKDGTCEECLLRAKVAELEAALATRYWEGIRDDNTSLRARIAELEACLKSASAEYNKRQRDLEGVMVARVAALEADAERLRGELDRAHRVNECCRNALGTLSDETRATILAVCRLSPGPCWCGAHSGVLFDAAADTGER